MTQGRIFRRARFTGKSESVEYSKKRDYSLAQQRNYQSAGSMSYVAGGRTWRYGTGLLVTNKSGGVILEGCGWKVENWVESMVDKIDWENKYWNEHLDRHRHG
jgi:hypothetical protein